MKCLTKVNEKNEIVHTPFIRHHLSRFKDQKVLVTVEQLHNKRSLNQNSYYWACLDIIADSTGHSPDELHRIFKEMFLPRKELLLKGKRYSISGSTTDLTKGKFVDYMLRIQAEVGQMGIILPSPDAYKRGLDEAVLWDENEV